MNIFIHKHTHTHQLKQTKFKTIQNEELIAENLEFVVIILNNSLFYNVWFKTTRTNKY